SFFTLADTLGFYAASSTPDESLLRLLRTQPEDTICVFPSGLGPKRDSETLRISSNATKDPVSASPWEGIDFSKTPDRKMLFFTVSKDTVTANPTGGEVALPNAARPTITVTETSVKDFLHHSQFLLESLNKLSSDADKSVPALTSGAPTTTP